MQALALAMILIGAGAIAQPPPPPMQTPPVPIMVPYPVPPAPSPRVVPPSRAFANLGAYFSADDYPAAAIDAEEEGNVGFQLLIGTDGRVAQCVVTASSGSVSLDAATCRILTARARYRPARDWRGNPMQGRDSGRVSWQLPLNNEDGRAGVPIPHDSAYRQFNFRTLLSPADYPEAAFRARAAGVSTVRLTVGTDGRVIACAVEEGSGSGALDAAACRIVTARARYGAAKDAAGAPLCDIDVIAVTWRLPASRPAWARPDPGEAAPGSLAAQLNATLCPGWTEPPPEEDTPPGISSPD